MATGAKDMASRLAAILADIEKASLTINSGTLRNEIMQAIRR